MQSVYQHEGIRGFYRGLAASAWTFTPASALWWPAYEASKVILGRVFAPEGGVSDGKPSLFLAFGCHLSHALVFAAATISAIVAASGGIAGCVASGLTNPMDLVRTRTVVGYGCYGETKPLRLIRAVVKNEGVSALAKGVIPRVMQVRFDMLLLLDQSCSSDRQLGNARICFGKLYVRIGAPVVHQT